MDPEHAVVGSWKHDEIELQYRIEEVPPFHFTVLFALQVRILLLTKISNCVKHVSYKGTGMFLYISFTLHLKSVCGRVSVACDKFVG